MAITITDVPAGFTFNEVAGNNGAIANSLTLRITDGTFAGNNGDLVDAAIDNVPDGLDAVLIKTSATTAKLTLTGTATAHAKAQNIDNLTVTFKAANFATGTGVPAAISNLAVNFNDPAAAKTLALVAPAGAGTSETYKADTLPTITGTLPDGVDKVYIYNNGGTKPIGTATITGNTWSFKLPTEKLKAGAYNLTASASADGKGAMTAGFAFTVDTKAPAAPSVTAIKGAISNTTPVLSGKAEKFAMVEVFADGDTQAKSLGVTFANAKGVWTLAVDSTNTELVKDGTYKITAKATDAAGNETKSKKPVDLTIDTTIATPTLDEPVLKKNTVALTGKVADETGGGTLQLYGGEDGSLALGKVIKIAKDGSWKTSVKLTDGKHLLSVVATDAAGNVSANSVVVEKTVDTFTATPTLELVKSGEVVTGLKGTAEANATVKITIGAEKDKFTVTADADGKWEQSLAAFKPAKLGKLKITAIATDGSKNVSKPSAAVEHTFADPVPDTAAPTLKTAETSFDGKTIVLTYDEELGGTKPTAEMFKVTYGTDDNKVKGVTVNGKTVILELTDAATDSNKALTVAYTAPAETTVATTDAAIQDAKGNNALSLTAEKVTYKLPTANNDTITGSEGADSIDGQAGNDVIDGGAGDDTLIGGVGNDILTGGAGNDTFTLTASATDVDVITDWGNGVDVLSGSTASGQTLKVSIFDTSKTAFSAATIFTSNGVVSVDGGDANDTITGGGNADTITGGAGDDSLTGGQGNDTLTGGAGNDTLTGGDGNDTFNVDAGTDTITDLKASDVLVVFADATAEVTVLEAFTATATTINAGTANLSTNGFAVNLADAGGANGFSVTNTGGATTITGGAKDDTITGGTNADSLVGGAGNDILVGGTGNDIITGGAGRDVLTGGAGDDTFVVSAQKIADGIDHITDFKDGADKLKTGITPSSAALTNLSFFSFDGSANLAAAAAKAVEGAISIAATNYDTAGDAVIFKFGDKTYITVNSATGSTFDDGTDVLVEITGVDARTVVAGDIIG